MRIEKGNLADADTIRACFQAYLAAQQGDEPDGPWLTERVFEAWLKVGWGGEPREVWVAAGPEMGPEMGAVADPEMGTVAGPEAGPEMGTEMGTVAGWYRLELPDLENLDQAEVTLVVHPARRRHGLGRAMLEHAAARAAEHGRSVLNGGTRDGSGGAAFARAMGAEPGLVDVQRVMDVRALGDEQLARLRETAAEAAAGYSLVSWTGLVPEEFVGQAAALFAALNDAPHDPHVAPAVWDAQRVRERVNGLRSHYGLRVYSLAARHDATGELAALTEIAVDPADPGWGHQMITGVIRAHRGHRLGLLVKTAMVEWVKAAEPTVERIQTWNAESNRYMIAVNEALGYTILGQPANWWRLEVAAVLGERTLAGRVSS